jgi:hypothetical protein
VGQDGYAASGALIGHQNRMEMVKAPKGALIVLVSALPTNCLWMGRIEAHRHAV